MHDCRKCRKYKRDEFCEKCNYEPKDLVDVVRCKDCKYWIRDEKDPGEYYGWCENSHWTYRPKYIETAENSYCSYGERAEE